MLGTITIGSSAEVAAIGNTLFFVGGDSAHGTELWQSDGTANGTKLSMDILPGYGTSRPAGLIEFNGAVYFSANNGSNGAELWKALPGSGPTSRAGSISGSVFFDKNKNSRQDGNEGGAEQLRVYIDKDRDGQFDRNEKSVLTDRNGNYVLKNLANKNYQVRVVPGAGHKPTYPLSGLHRVTINNTRITNLVFGVGRR